MAKLYLTEYERVTIAGGAAHPMASAPAKAMQVVPITAVSQRSAAFGPTAVYVRVHADAVCSVEFGANPVATTQMTRMAANQTEYFSVSAGDKVAVISNT